MALTEAKKALERRLTTLSPSLPTAYEGVSFTPPATMYQRVQFLIKNPEDVTIGDTYYREQIQMQVFVVDEPNKGTTSAITRAELIRNLFKKGTTLLEGDNRIHVLSTPKVAGVGGVGNRVIVPVLIDVKVEDYS